MFTTADDTPLYAFMQASPDRAINRFADAYIQTRYDSVQSASKTEVTSMPHFADWMELSKFEDSFTYEDATFWVAYVSTGYESERQEDHDPLGEKSRIGITSPSREMSVIFLETTRDYAETGLRPAMDVNEALKRITVHEVGHQFWLARPPGPMHEDGVHRKSDSIMNIFPLRVQTAKFFFDANDIADMRFRILSPGSQNARPQR